METSPKPQNSPNPSPLPSPNTCSTSSPINGRHFHHHPSPPLTTRSETSNPFPTTFVQADTSSFKQVVQMLTGSSDTAKHASDPPPPPPPQQQSKSHIPLIKSLPKKQQSGSGFKLYERRNSLKNLNINPLNSFFPSNNSGFSPRKPEMLSPSILDFPSLVLSPVTPLIYDPFDRSPAANFDREAEEKAIKEKGFYLHPSPSTTPRDPEPRLLPLFPNPVTNIRIHRHFILITNTVANSTVAGTVVKRI